VRLSVWIASGALVFAPVARAAAQAPASADSLALFGTSVIVEAPVVVPVPLAVRGPLMAAPPRAAQALELARDPKPTPAPVATAGPVVPAPVAEAAIEPDSSSASPLTLPGSEGTPSAVVARLAREALRHPSDPSTWGALADELPELALSGTANLDATFDAARLADSLAAGMAPTTPSDEVATLAVSTAGAVGSVGSRLSSLRARAAGIVTWFRSVRIPRPTWPLAAWAAGVFALVGLPVWAALRLRRRAAAEKPDPVPASNGGVYWVARSLVTAGTPVSEVARQTGLSQDAIHVLLRLERPIA